MTSRDSVDTSALQSALFPPPARQSLAFQPVLVVSRAALRLDRYFHSAYSKAYYSILVLVTLFSILWSLIALPRFADQNWFRFMETLVMVLFGLDYCLRVLWMGRHYCCSVGNALDLSVLVTSLFALVVEIEGNVEADIGTTGAIVVVLIRSTVQFVRVAQLVKYSRSTHDRAQANLLNGAEGPKNRNLGDGNDEESDDR